MVAIVNKDECIGCGVCVDACPSDAIKMVDDLAVIDEEL
ncbi:MAG: 4Fe-4S binding protein, partial [Thermoplasmata archaeon]|nr:4Fe-4S binding protein [Thermoplasmata archaeon]